MSILARMSMASALALAFSLPAQADPVRDLVKAAELDNPVVVRNSLSAGLSPNTIDPIAGEPILLLALREGSQQVVDVLLARPDLQLELTAPNGNTALMMAAFKHNKAAVHALLTKGAKVNRPGWSALHFAAASGDEAITRDLLARGAAIDARAPNEQTPLMVAAREGQEACVQALLRAGADVSLKSGDGFTAAQIAERADKPRIAAMITQFLANGK
jgi:ankyrin repeat protein